MADSIWRICCAPMAHLMSNFPHFHAEFTLAAAIRFCV
jgi:hypothetical protein